MLWGHHSSTSGSSISNSSISTSSTKCSCSPSITVAAEPRGGWFSMHSSLHALQRFFPHSFPCQTHFLATPAYSLPGHPQCNTMQQRHSPGGPSWHVPHSLVGWVSQEASPCTEMPKLCCSRWALTWLHTPTLAQPGQNSSTKPLSFVFLFGFRAIFMFAKTTTTTAKPPNLQNSFTSFLSTGLGGEPTALQ